MKLEVTVDLFITKKYSLRHYAKLGVLAKETLTRIIDLSFVLVSSIFLQAKTLVVIPHALARFSLASAESTIVSLLLRHNSRSLIIRSSALRRL